MAQALSRLARFCVRHHWAVIAAWVVTVIAVAALGGKVQVNDDVSIPGSDSQQATDLLEDRFPSQANGTNPIVLHTDEGTLRDGERSQAVADAAKALEGSADVREVVSPLSKQGAPQLSKDGKTGYLSLNLVESAGELTEEEADEVIALAAEPAEEAGLDVAAGGYLGQKVSRPETHDSEAVGLAMAVLVLLMTFGTAAAMGIPLMTAIIGLIGGIGGIALLSHTIDVPNVAPTLGIMIGLGVGIDYALFVITRHRTQLGEGMAMEDSIAKANSTAGGAVVFAGGTVIIALASLAVAGIPLVRTLGFTAAMVVAIAVLAAVTLLPAILGAFGKRIDAGRVRKPKPVGAASDAWRRWAEGVSRHPWIALIASVLILGALAVPVLDLRLGQSDNGAMPEDTDIRQSNDLLEKPFGPGVNGPMLVAVSLDSKATGQDDPRLAKLAQSMGATEGVAAVSPPRVNDAGDAAVFTLTTDAAPSSEETEDVVARLRDDVLPAATEGQGMDASVGGRTAGFVDLAAKITDKLPLVMAVVIALSFLLLMLAFRSIVIPLKAGLMNLVSIGAAFGVLTLVFQEGVGAELIGLDGAVPIVAFVPLMMFAVLFGLSMDYEVFLMSRIQEEHDKGHSNRDSVVTGLALTGRIITAAALIMASVFCSFILNGDPVVKQFGVGMAVAVAVDATIVRCLLVPAAMLLMDKANWWFPSWLGWVPKVSIEGE